MPAGQATFSCSEGGEKLVIGNAGTATAAEEIDAAIASPPNMKAYLRTRMLIFDFMILPLSQSTAAMVLW